MDKDEERREGGDRERRGEGGGGSPVGSLAASVTSFEHIQGCRSAQRLLLCGLRHDKSFSSRDNLGRLDYIAWGRGFHGGVGVRQVGVAEDSEERMVKGRM